MMGECTLKTSSHHIFRCSNLAIPKISHLMPLAPRLGFGAGREAVGTGSDYRSSELASSDGHCFEPPVGLLAPDLSRLAPQQRLA